ncbi:sigma-B regulation protein RsbU (phosphoserine phosphatase) [Pseudoxanthobacter soli DSM 19599]|uniref:Sigma-B regulation protein RsbU (Phosphoserine phosphatase) n=1 Tax=Pseudoxanthobacter soli DSM 19599 TaxID=1123029 RepID=A0A1M7Z6Z5_9HYPH|nr:SpoIIE family protein phosphatase [Pseudoxanthobacter soli]SHO60624.1 sigma-B regulation protein RsbU (phosphoserine phosphatase) [Pseudoxanthobacter soli DSM 19599]
MLLRTRLTLFLSIAFLIVLTVLLLASAQRDESESNRFAAVAIAGQQALWQVLLQQEVEDLNRTADTLVKALGPLDSADPADLRRRIVEAVASASAELSAADMVQVVDLDRNRLYSNTAGNDQRPLLDVIAAAKVARSKTDVGGLLQDNPNRYVVVSAVPLAVRGKVIAILTVARDAAPLLQRFAQAYGAPAFLVTLRGRMITGTDPTLWAAAQPEVPRRHAEVKTLDLATDERLMLATSVPVPDLVGGYTGTLVSLRDTTETLGDVRDAEQLGLMIIGAFLLITLGWLFFYLRRSFQPLESAISVLKALSQGNTSVEIEETGDGEIRAIADTVSVFRRNAIELAQTNMETERQRRRQERLIKRQLEALARTLEHDGRTAVMEDLTAIVGGSKGNELQADPETGQLGLLAALLQRMSARIVDQHNRLRELVAELRESIATRAKLAGLQQELEIARELQLSILPKELPACENVDIHGRMTPAKEIGGDFYDFFLFGHGKLGVVVADVSGKGVPAAMFMAITRTLLKATTLFSERPSDCVELLNDVIATENDQMMFVTLFFGVLDLQTGRLDYVNAGHNPPLVKSPGQPVRIVPRTGGMAVAVMGGQHYADASLILGEGDLLLLYTDGVTEAFDIDEVAFGDQRLADLVQDIGDGQGTTAITDDVFRAVREFERGATQADDITCVALRYLGPSQTPFQSSGGGAASYMRDRRISSPAA